MKHVTVLKTEAVDALNLSEDSVVVDATFGSGGHGEHILSILGEGGTYIGIDADSTALKDKESVLNVHDASVILVADNFKHISTILSQNNIEKVDAILADLGWRTEQFTEGNKGFSFHDESPLMMTYGDPKDYAFTAYDIVNEWDEEHIADVIFGYGEERQSRRIARAIVEAREVSPIKTAKYLADIIERAIPKRFHPKRIHPATRSFQALRIAVNDELGALGTLIEDGVQKLSTGGRMAIITFHSIEDRLVKRLFMTYAQQEMVVRVTKKPQVPSREEILENPRARSAKLRIIEKL